MPTPTPSPFTPAIDLNLERLFTRQHLSQPGPLRNRLAAAAWLKDYLIWERPHGGFVAYSRWTPRQKDRLDNLFRMLEANEPNLGLRLPDVAGNLARTIRPEVGGRNLCLTAEEGFDIYAAHVAHALYLEGAGLVPWSLADLSDLELADLFSSDRYHSRIVRRARTGYNDYYPSHIRPDTDFQLPEWAGATRSMLGDPRVGYRFLRGETSSRGTDLVAATRLETMVNLTRWAAENLMHGSDEHHAAAWTQQHAYLVDRLRGSVPTVAAGSPAGAQPYSTSPVIPAPLGCHGAMNVVRDLARSVNIPLLALNGYDTPPGPGALGERHPPPSHGALLFLESGSWGAAGRLRLLPHIDEVYAESLAPFYPLGPGGKVPTEAEKWRIFFDALWQEPAALARWGYLPPASYGLGERNHPADDRPTLGIDGGAWTTTAHKMAFLFERAMRLGSWTNFLALKCDNFYGDFGTLDSRWNLYRGTNSSPRATYRTMLDKCLAQEGGCDTLRNLFKRWRGRRTNVGRGG